MTLKLALGLVASIVLASAVFYGRNQHDRAQALQMTVDDQAACVASIKLAPRADRPSVRCGLVVLMAVTVAQQRIDCDSALDGGDAFAIRAACSAPVKVVLAQRDGAQAERDGFKADIARLHADQTAVLSRAVSRATAQTLKESKAHAALNALPRDSDGLSVCGDDCLRGLAGAAGPAAGGPGR